MFVGEPLNSLTKGSLWLEMVRFVRRTKTMRILLEATVDAVQSGTMIRTIFGRGYKLQTAG